MKLLLLEDSLSDIDACVTTAETYKDEKKRDLEILVAKNIDEARHELYINDCDGAIIDLRIEANPLAGKQIVDFISSLNLRMPIVIFTGTPDEASSIACCIGKFNKGEITYAKIFDLFFDVAQTGLIKIMGRKGIIENCLNSVYRQDIIPAIGRWTELAGKFSGDEIERALCRHTLSHLLFMLSGNSELYFPEECYLHIDAQKGFPKSGEIIKNSENVFFAILTPPCDLEVRHDRDGDHVNVDRIQIVQFLPESELKNKIMHTSSPTRRQCEHWDKICHNEREKYLHYLPPAGDFAGGFLNFRDVVTIKLEEYSSTFSSLNLLIAPDFFKDILSRFSGYYSRQGQPELRITC